MMKKQAVSTLLSLAMVCSLATPMTAWATEGSPHVQVNQGEGQTPQDISKRVVTGTMSGPVTDYNYAGDGTTAHPYQILVKKLPGDPPNVAPKQFWGDPLQSFNVIFEQRKDDVHTGELLYSYQFNTDESEPGKLNGTDAEGNRFRFTPYSESRANADGTLDIGVSWKGNFRKFFNNWVFKANVVALSNGTFQPGDKVVVRYYGDYNKNFDSSADPNVNYDINLDHTDKATAWASSAKLDANGFLALTPRYLMMQYGGNYKIEKAPAPVPVPVAPELKAEAGDKQVTLTWGKVANATSYILYQDDVKVETAVLGADTTAYTVTGLTNDKEYKFALAAKNGSSTGPRSAPVMVTPNISNRVVTGKMAGAVTNWNYAGDGTAATPYQILVKKVPGDPPNVAPNKFWGDPLQSFNVIFEQRKDDIHTGELLYSYQFNTDESVEGTLNGRDTAGNRFRFTPYSESRANADGTLDIGFSWKGTFSTFWKDWIFSADVKTLSGGTFQPGDKVKVSYYGGYNKNFDTQSGWDVTYDINFDQTDETVAWTANTTLDKDGYLVLSGKNKLNYGGNYKIEKVANQFELLGTSVVMGNDLDMMFAIPSDGVKDWTGCYAVVERTYADGREKDVVRYTSDSWTKNDSTFTITYQGVAAKEMCDTITVTIYNKDGEVISKPWIDSLRDYSMRVLEKSSDNASVRTLLVDMLNYGAEAQTFFHYGESDLANSKLTDEQKGYASQSREVQNNRVSGQHYWGSSLNLENRITLMMAFDGVTSDMTAKVAFTDHYGKQVTKTLNGDQLAADQSGVTIVSVEDLVVADARQMVTVTIYNADGTEYTSVQESIESYLARQGTLSPLFGAIMRFADSAYTFLHS